MSADAKADPISQRDGPLFAGDDSRPSLMQTDCRSILKKANVQLG